MLTQYSLQLMPKNSGMPEMYGVPEQSPQPGARYSYDRLLKSGCGYRMYAALLEKVPREVGEQFHADAVTPVSQYLYRNAANELIWTVNLLGEASEQNFAPILETEDNWHLWRDNLDFLVVRREKRSIQDVEELLQMAAEFRGPHRLLLSTPTAFKQQGSYVALPSTHLILQNLLRKWNGCITDCPIEDTDGEGEAAMVRGLQIRRFDVHSEKYLLKKAPIDGCVGRIEVENHLNGFHRQLADALLLFSDFAGLGIKTALGMGGVRHR